MALPLAVLLSRPPTVPPSVGARHDRQSREDNHQGAAGVALRLLVQDLEQYVLTAPNEPSDPGQDGAPHQGSQAGEGNELDRKSTRLNSSHSQISYAVFCLKKKKK